MFSIGDHDCSHSKYDPWTLEWFIGDFKNNYCFGILKGRRRGLGEEEKVKNTSILSCPLLRVLNHLSENPLWHRGLLKITLMTFGHSGKTQVVFIFLNDIFILHVVGVLSAQMSAYHMPSWCLWSWKEGLCSPGPWVTDGYELPHTNVGSELGPQEERPVFLKSVSQTQRPEIHWPHTQSQTWLLSDKPDSNLGKL